MNSKFKLLMILTIIMTLLTSCGAPPVPTNEPPVSTQIPIKDLTVVLIVDNYSVIDETPTEEPLADETPTDASLTETVENNCVVTSDGQGLSGGRGSSTTVLGEPHGFSVYRDFVNQVESSRFTNPISDAPSFTGSTMLRFFDSSQNQITDDLSFIKRVDLFWDADGDKGLIVVAVDTIGFDYDQIFTNTPKAIELFSDNYGQLENYFWEPGSDIAVNLSFVFVPCELDSVLSENLAQLLENNGISGTYTTIEELDGAFKPDNPLYGEVNSISPLANLGTRLKVQELESDVIDDAIFDAFLVYLLYDPMVDRSWLNSFTELETLLSSYSNVVYVAAAGNFESPFPYAPASWDFVISASSNPTARTEDVGLLLAKYSNNAEIRDDGIYSSDSKVEGTSYASPKLSYKIALYLLDGGISPCPARPDVNPVIGYAFTKDPEFTDAAGMPIAEINLTYADARSFYCP